MPSSKGGARREQKELTFVQQVDQFIKDSQNFFNKCSKPDMQGKCDSVCE